MKTKNLFLFKDITGDKRSILLYEYGKGEKSIYIQGGIHGGEVTYFIFNELHKYLSINEGRLNKRVLLAPIVNPLAWNQRVYYYTVGKFDLYKGSDWNRSYPGNQTTLSARNSSLIFKFAKEFDLTIDLHTARQSNPYVIFMKRNLLPYVKALGLPFNFFYDLQKDKAKKYLGTLNSALAKIGRDAIAIECGSHDSFEPENVSAVCLAIKRIFIQKGIIAENKEYLSKSEKAKVFDRIDTIFSPLSGFAEYMLRPYSKFKKNDTLCRILCSDKLGKIHLVKAPYAGYLLEIARSNIIWPGDELFRVIPEKNIKELIL